MKKIKNNKEQIKHKDYQDLLKELKSIIDKGKNKSYKAVDNILVETRWQIGERIFREELKYKNKADYGEYLIKYLAVDLDTTKQRLSEIIRFYRCYPIVRSLSGQLSWKHYTILVPIEDQKERKFYENKTVINSWSSRGLIEQINKHLYQKTDHKDIEATFKTTMANVINKQNVFKSDYDFKFLSIKPNHQEKELENKIISNMEAFLKELGGDFLFLGRQVPILIDRERHYIDLVLFHRGVPCIVLVDLKIGKFDSRDIGQMNKYISYYRNNKQFAYEKDAIGLIICLEMGSEEVIYALGGLEERIFVALYKIKLPSESKIKRVIRKLD